MARKRKAVDGADDSLRKKPKKAKGGPKQMDSPQPKPVKDQLSKNAQQSGDVQQQDRKKQQQKPAVPTARDPVVKNDLLARYFTRVETLRAYLLTRLPSSSRLRRKKLLSVGKSSEASAVEQLLSHVLDTTLVACADNGPKEYSDLDQNREQLRETFSQTKRADESYVTVSSAAEGVFSHQAEIVDFVIWLLFSRSKKSGRGFGTGYPENVLCHGYQRGQKLPYHNVGTIIPGVQVDAYPASTIPSLYTTRTPQNAQTLKEPPWPQLLAILGASAERIMTDLLLHCSLFLPVDAGIGNYVQLTGQPLFSVLSASANGQNKAENSTAKAKPPSEIVFARNYMFYCRPSLTTRDARVHFGLSPKPTGAANGQESTPQSGDEETRDATNGVVKGTQKKQTKEAAQPGNDVSAPAGSAPLINLATPLPQVSAFCRAVIHKVVPDDFWGTGEAGANNKASVLKKVDMFVRLQRHENINLHGVLQGLKIAEVKWLAPPKLKYDKMSQTDMQKRQEIYAEFLYFLFDGLLIPVIANNFYVTESSTHRNQIFYFRQDVWRSISEPAMAVLKSTRLEELKSKEAVQLIEARGLGFGKLRLMPKKTTMRSIVNLRRAIPKKGDPRAAPSINAVLRPVAAMLNLEMKEHPERLGSGMLSTRNMYARLKGFRERMHAKNKRIFYLAKVDVQSAFDTIPQAAMVKLLGTVPEHPTYHIDQHVEIAVIGADMRRREAEQADSGLATNKGAAATPVSRQIWRTVAKAGDSPAGFHDAVEDSMARGKRDTVFVDSAFRKTRDAESLAKLAATHILDNIVKVGGRYYRQKEGIPQGSVLSSTLCSYFYADLEEKELSFLKPSMENGAVDEDCILLRMIDDFLVISTNRSKAARFIEVMQRGHPRYGVAVNPSKSLVNFSLTIDGKPVPRLTEGQPFPYCGTKIHCSTLDLAQDRESKMKAIFNTITVDHTRSQGYNFKRKILNSFQIQAHHMFFDTSYNSRRTTLRNLHDAFAETANKMWAYARCMPKTKRPSAQLTISAIEEVGAMAYGILHSKTRTQQSYEFSVSKAHLR
ncbi:Telomerase reverse transcriptase [Sporothrix eucalyptigena]|uniref:Telomerase reverse transcriptase n=1 Tax=Sporothrix eucalyptigena TaxID=1812306 RepID=A0ABP0BRF3_9PEZI